MLLIQIKKRFSKFFLQFNYNRFIYWGKIDRYGALGVNWIFLNIVKYILPTSFLSIKKTAPLLELDLMITIIHLRAKNYNVFLFAKKFFQNGFETDYYPLC